MKGGAMIIVLAIIFLFNHAGSQAASSDNVVLRQSSNRLLVTHVVLINDSENKEERESASRDLDREVAKDKKFYNQNGFNVMEARQTRQNRLAASLWQVDHLEIPAPKIQPRE